MKPIITFGDLLPTHDLCKLKYHTKDLLGYLSDNKYLIYLSEYIMTFEIVIFTGNFVTFFNVLDVS